MPDKRIVSEPLSEIRAAARRAMKGRWGVLFGAALLYALCLNVPIIVVEQISGFWGSLEAAMGEYYALLGRFAAADAASSYADLMNPNGAFYAAVNEWAEGHVQKLQPSFATWLFFLMVPGPLVLGCSFVWLRVLRGQEAFADMVFSGFGNFARALLLHFARSLFMALWAFLLVVPGIIAYYRYSVAFFLLADNPGMNPLEALALSKYYMQGNKGSRFVLDLSFLGWFALSIGVMYGIDSAVLAAPSGVGADSSLFAQQLVGSICGAFVMGPVAAYRGVSAAEYYHRVICRDPKGFLGQGTGQRLLQD